MPKAISYVRFSSLQQGKGSTVERQEQMIRDWFVRNPDYEPSSLSRVDRGLSGYKAEHLADGGGLKAIQDAIQEGLIVKGDVLLVEAVDRLGRLNHVEMTALIGGILNAGVDIVTLDDNQRYTFERLNSDGAWLLTGKIQQAHSYSDALSRRITKSYESRREKASKGEPIRIAKAIWLDQNGKLKEPESRMVRTAIELYKDGKGTRAIVAALKAEFGGIAPKDAKSITRWLTTRALLGEWQGYKVFDALVEHSEFLELQRMFKSRRLIGKPPESFFLSGLIKCGRCGKSFNVRRQKPKATKDAPIDSEAYLNKPHILYANCRSYLKNSSCDNNATWPLEVLEYIMNKTSDDVLIGIAEGRAISSVTAKALNELEAEHTTLKQQIARLQELFYDSGEIHLRQKAKAHVQRVKVVENEIATLKASVAYPKANELSFEELESLRNEHRAIAQNEYKQIIENKNAIKSLLKMYGYSIQINGRQAYCPDSSESVTFTLGKRKQKYGCYIVKIEHPENERARFAAISRTRPVIWDYSESSLLAQLEEQR